MRQTTAGTPSENQAEWIDVGLAAGPADGVSLRERHEIVHDGRDRDLNRWKDRRIFNAVYYGLCSISLASAFVLAFPAKYSMFDEAQRRFAVGALALIGTNACSFLFGRSRVRG